MELDTRTIRRLRDALIASGRLQSDSLVDDAETIVARRQASILRVTPFVETLYLVMIADGHEVESERDAILGAVSMLTHGFLDGDALDSLLSDCKETVDRHGVEFRLQSVGAQISANRQDREIAFTLAAAVAMADETLSDQEDSLIHAIAEWYGISSKRGRQLLEQL